MDWNCNSCGAHNDGQGRFCVNCGAPHPTGGECVCPECQSSQQAFPGMRCGRCGHTFDERDFAFSASYTDTSDPAPCPTSYMDAPDPGPYPAPAPPQKKNNAVVIIVVTALIVAGALAALFMPKYFHRDKPDGNGGAGPAAAAVQATTSPVSVTAAAPSASTVGSARVTSSDRGLAEYSVGGVISFGTYEQDGDMSDGPEPIEWIIIDKADGRLLLISRYALDCKQYNTVAGPISWEDCSLRRWLNRDFLYAAFTAEEQGKIGSSHSPLSDKVFALSKAEALRYFPSAAGRRAGATAAAAANGSYLENGFCGWWLRDSGDTALLAARVNIYGDILTDGSSEGGAERRDYSVRPALWLEP